MPFTGVRVDGLPALDRAFARFGEREKEMLRGRLAAAAEPVRKAAEQNALIQITNIGPDWEQMRVGVTRRMVYVAPARRRGRNPNLARPNLAPLLAVAMEDALDEEREEVVGLLDEMLGTLSDEWAA